MDEVRRSPEQLCSSRINSNKYRLEKEEGKIGNLKGEENSEGCEHKNG